MGSTARVKVTPAGEVILNEVISGSMVRWARLGTDGIGWENVTGAENTVEWYAADFDGYDPPGTMENDLWELQIDAGAGVFGDDVYHLFAKKSGIYTFTQQLLTSDLDATPPKAFEYQTRLQVLNQAFSFAGQIGSSSYLQDKEQFWIDDDSGDDLWLNRSWTIPVQHDNEGVSHEMGQMHLLHSNIDLFWSIRLWITYHGERLP